MDKLLTTIRTFLKSLSANQKLLLGGSVVVVALVIVLFVHLFAAADFKNLYTGLDPTDTQKIIQRLAAENISYQVSTDGTSVDVEADRLDRVRIEMASENLPHTGRMGFELFDKPNWSGSDFSERVNYQRALEAELERTIETMDTVESARVHLVLPHESLFTSEERPAKAAVVVKLRTQRMADQTINAIANLVASAWENLSPNDVTIVSADGNVPLSGGKPGGKGDLRGIADLETTMAERIVDTLTPIVGANHVKSSVTIEFNSSYGESTQEEYDPNATAVLSSQVMQDQSSGAGAAGIPGTQSNVPGAQPTPAPTKPGDVVQGMRNESKTFAVSKTVHHVVEPAGQIRRLAAAVLVDDDIEMKDVKGKPEETRRKRTPEEMKQLEALVHAVLGFDPKRGDELAIQNISFQVPAVEVPLAPSAGQRILQIVTPWIGLLRYLGLALLFAAIYFLVLRPIKNQVLTAMKALPGTGRQDALPAAEGKQGQRKLAASPADIQNQLENELSGAGGDVNRAVALKRHLVEKMKKDPDANTRLVQSWVREDENA